MGISIDTEGIRPGGVGRKMLRSSVNSSSSSFVSYGGSSATAGDVADSEIPTLRVATTANITLSGSQTIDGVTLADGDAVLVKNQLTTTENGYYSYNSSGAWSRLEVTIRAGQVVSILEGTTNGDALFLCTNDTTPTIGTDAIAFERVSGSIDGSGTANYVARWTDSDTLGVGLIKDDNTRVQIGSTSTTGILNVERSTASAAVIYVRNTSATGAASALYVQSDSTTGGSYAGEFVANGAGGDGLYVHGGTGSNGIVVETTTGTGIFSAPIGNGYAIYAYRNVSGANTPIVQITEDHAASTANTFHATNDGTGRTAYIQRNNGSAGQPVLEVYEQSTTATQQALYVHNDSTSAAANAIRAAASGGIGVSGRSAKVQAGYFFRTTAATAATAETFRIEQQYTGDANDVLLIRSDGTGPALRISDGGTDRLKVEDGGVINTTNSGVRHDYKAKSANYTLTNADHIIGCQTSTAAGGFTITLPATPTAGKEFILIDVENNAGTKNVTLARNGNSIDSAAANKVLNTNNFRLIIWSDGTNWFTK